MITREKLLEILKDLPPVRLEIIDLTWKLVDKGGHLLGDKVSFHYTEVERAIGQAQAYAQDTHRIVSCLKKLIP